MNGMPMMVDRDAMVSQARSFVQQSFKDIEEADERNTAHIKRLDEEIAALKAADLRWTTYYVEKAIRDRLAEADIQLAACRLTLGRLIVRKNELTRRSATFEEALRQLPFAPSNLL